MPARDPQKRLVILRQRTVEMFGLPGDVCRHAICRRSARCRSVTPAGPDCLAQLGADEKVFFKRLMQFAEIYDAQPANLSRTYSLNIDDAFIMLTGEIVRRAQPPGHWLNRMLPDWYQMTTGRTGRAPLSLEAAMKTPRRCY